MNIKNCLTGLLLASSIGCGRETETSESQGLTITIKGTGYECSLNIRDPELIERYRENPLSFERYIKGNVDDGLGDLNQPEQIATELMHIKREFIKRKIDYLSEKRK